MVRGGKSRGAAALPIGLSADSYCMVRPVRHWKMLRTFHGHTLSVSANASAMLCAVAGTQKFRFFYFIPRTEVASEASLNCFVLFCSLAAGIKPITCLHNAQTAVPESTMIGLSGLRHTVDLQQTWPLVGEC